VSHELELKLELQSGRMPAVADIARLLGRDLSGPRRVEKLDSLYFDNSQRKLWRHGISLRIRRDGHRRLQTVKWLKPSELFDRGESETEIDGKIPDWTAIRGTALEPLATRKLRRSIKPVFRTKVRRTVYPVTTEAANIELAFDHGTIHAGKRSEPIRELELELKAGQGSELFRVARELCRRIPARLLLKSKAERGYELFNGGAAAAAVKAGAIELSAGTTIAEAFRIIARSCLSQIVANEAGMQAGDSEALHQLRIGLRRLRATISFFSDIVGGPQTDAVKSELKCITRELAAARELDVYISQVLTPFRARHEGDSEVRDLCDEFEGKRNEAFARAVAAIRSDRYRQLLLDLAAWVEIRDWGLAEDEAARSMRERRIEDYAAEQLGKRRKKILKNIRKFEQLDAAQRHKLRIAMKKFRYAVESVASVFASKKAKRRWRALQETVKQIQDCLGGLNDIIAHKKLGLEILDQQTAARRQLPPDRIFLAGQIAGQQEAAAGKLQKGAAAAFADFRAVKPFWT
jgi:triphosphatase